MFIFHGFTFILLSDISKSYVEGLYVKPLNRNGSCHSHGDAADS